MTKEEYKIKYLKEIEDKQIQAALDLIKERMFIIDMCDKWDENDRNAYMALLEIKSELERKLEAKDE